MTANSQFLIDIDQILRAKAGKKAKYVPPFVVSYLKRIVHQDEINEFYSATAGGVSITVFACHVKSMLKAKDGRGYTDSMWYVLPEDCIVPDADNLTIAELKAFRCTQQNQKVS